MIFCCFLLCFLPLMIVNVADDAVRHFLNQLATLNVFDFLPLIIDSLYNSSVWIDIFRKFIKYMT